MLVYKRKQPKKIKNKKSKLKRTNKGTNMTSQPIRTSTTGNNKLLAKEENTKILRRQIWFTIKTRKEWDLFNS